VAEEFGLYIFFLGEFASVGKNSWIHVLSLYLGQKTGVGGLVCFFIEYFGYCSWIGPCSLQIEPVKLPEYIFLHGYRVDVIEQIGMEPFGQM
jgi:hypothetical protein